MRDKGTGIWEAQYIKVSRRTTGMTRDKDGDLKKERSPRKYYRGDNNGRTGKMSCRFSESEVIADVHLDVMREQG